jgi:hypothetical protein
MASPFPGVDPFLEGQGVWRDFHHTFITSWREFVMRKLPTNYIARVDEQVYLDRNRGGDPGERVPDVVVEQTGPHGRPRSGGKSASMTVEPIVLRNVMPDPIRQGYIEVRRKSDDSIVSVLELLSPTNKSGSGRGEYLLKRDALLQQAVHLVEVDLLLKGPRLPLDERLPDAHFYAYVSRGDHRPDCEVFHWTIRDPCPPIPIPLEPPDGDVSIDLQEIFDATFNRVPFDALVRYDRPLELSLPESIRTWIKERLGAMNAD